MDIPQVQFLEKVVDVPVVCNVWCLLETVQKTVEVLQLALIDKVDDVPVVQVVVWFSRTVKVPQIQFFALTEDIPVASRLSTFPSWRRGSFPWSWTPLRFSSCSSLTRWSTFVVQVLQFSGAVVEETAELPQLQLVELFGQGR